jgi:flagellar protein FlaJ
MSETVVNQETVGAKVLKKKNSGSASFLDGFKSLFSPVTNYFEKYMESNRIDMDVLYMLTYMNSVATANISRDEIFKKVAERKEFACSKYMEEVYVLAKYWNYDYSTACTHVSKKVSNPRLKELLLRLGNAMASGETEKKFLENEWNTMMIIYKNEYERSLESLKKWTDAFTALLVSMSFISITIVLSITLYNMGDPVTMLTATAMMIGLVGFIGIVLIRAEAPKEIKTHSLAHKSDEQQLVDKLYRTLIPIAVIVACVMFILNLGGGLVLVAVGIILFPIGWVGKKDDKMVDLRDKDFSQFTKMLGSVVGSMGLTVKEGITRVDKKAIGTLEPEINRLYSQLIMGMDSQISWKRFIGSTGSELINKFTHIFTDAIDMGGDATKIGKLVNTTNLEIVLLRMKRKLVSSSFTTLIIPMHVCMCGLVVFVVQILVIFSGMIAKLYATINYNANSTLGIGNAGISPSDIGFTLFQNVPGALLLEYCVVLVLILTVVNTFAAWYVEGGDKYKLFFYGPIMMATSGLCLIVVPFVVQGIFNIPAFQTVI